MLLPREDFTVPFPPKAESTALRNLHQLPLPHSIRFLLRNGKREWDIISFSLFGLLDQASCKFFVLVVYLFTIALPIISFHHWNHCGLLITSIQIVSMLLGHKEWQLTCYLESDLLPQLWAHLLTNQLMCNSFSWPCLWEHRFLELFAHSIALKLPCTGCKFALAAFYQCDCDG